MFFSWWCLVLVVIYGVSGADVAHEYGGVDNGDAEAESYGGRSLGGYSGYEDYGYYRAETAGPELVSGGLDKVISMVGTIVDGTKKLKRSGYRNLAASAISADLEKKIKDAQLYADMMNKYIKDDNEGKKRSSAWEQYY